MPKCRPHDWDVPDVGVDGLTCLACGRFLDFMHDITLNMRASIVNAFEARHGDMMGGTFRVALDAAVEDARRRYRPPPLPAGLLDSVRPYAQATMPPLPKTKLVGYRP